MSTYEDLIVFEANASYKFPDRPRFFSAGNRGFVSFVEVLENIKGERKVDHCLLRSGKKEILKFEPGKWLLLPDITKQSIQFYDVDAFHKCGDVYSSTPYFILKPSTDQFLKSIKDFKSKLKVESFVVYEVELPNERRRESHLFITSKYLFFISSIPESYKLEKLFSSKLRLTSINIKLEKHRGENKVNFQIQIDKPGFLIKSIIFETDEPGKICEIFRNFYAKNVIVTDPMNILNNPIPGSPRYTTGANRYSTPRPVHHTEANKEEENEPPYLDSKDINLPKRPHAASKEDENQPYINQKNQNSPTDHSRVKQRKGGVYRYYICNDINQSTKANLDSGKTPPANDTASCSQGTDKKRGNRYEYIDINKRPSWDELEFKRSSQNQQNESVKLLAVLYTTLENTEENWCLSVIFFKSDCEQEYIKKYQILEKLNGRVMVNNGGQKLLNVKTDIKISLELGEKYKNLFSLADEDEQLLLSYNEIKELDQRSWIVCDLCYDCNTNEIHGKTKFQCEVFIHCMEEPKQELLKIKTKSLYQNQNHATAPFIVDEVETRIPPPPMPTPTLPMSASLRTNLCSTLDLPSIKDWKAFAAEVPLEWSAIEAIENQVRNLNNCNSFTELVFSQMEKRFPEKCTIDNLATIFSNLKRQDLLELLLTEHPKGVCSS